MSTSRRRPAVNVTDRDVLDVDTDKGLRAALSIIAAGSGETRSALWESIGSQLLQRAARDARFRERHMDEYVSAYVTAALEALTMRQERVVNADSPWALLVVIGRRAALRAVALIDAGGLTARDPVTHRVRPGAVPGVLSLDRLRDETGFDVEYPSASQP